MKTIASLLIMCLAHNSVASVYIATSVLFFTPFSAIADAFIDQANDGKSLGSTIRSDFVLPEMDSASGKMTLKNGAANGQTIQQNELFQEVVPGSMDAAVDAYGNNDTMGIHVKDKLNELVGSGSSQGIAYQTLVGSNTAMPNLRNDSIWKTSDDVLGQKSDNVNAMFTGCQKNTEYSEASCGVHVKNLKTCRKSAKTEICKVQRNIKPLANKTVKLVSVKDFGEYLGQAKSELNEISLDQVSIRVGTTNLNEYKHQANVCSPRQEEMTINVSDGSRIDSATITSAGADDNVVLTIDGTTVFDSGGCDNRNEWNSNYNIDIRPYLTTGEHKLKLSTYVANSNGAYGGWVSIAIKKKLDFADDFIDSPVGCRQRLFDSWPPSGSPSDWTIGNTINDLASTAWWQCTDAAYTRAFGGLTIDTGLPNTFSFLRDILPEPLASPPAPICFSAETRIPGHVKLPCFTDLDGYQQCPEFDYNTDAHDNCESFANRPQCGYIGEQCAEGAINPVTGACQEFIVTYDCGTTQATSCDLVKSTDKTICDSEIRCIGGECVDPAEESSRDFTRVAAALQTLNQAQQSNGCDASTGACKLFEGEGLSCQMADLSILGKVDCCNMPIEGSWIDYLELGYKSWLLTDMSVEAYAVAEYGGTAVSQMGAWSLATQGTAFADSFMLVKDAYTAITEPFTSAYDSVVSMLGEKIGTDLGIETMKQQAMQGVADWMSETFGKQAAETIFSYGSEGAVSGLSSTLSSVFTVIGIVYAIYNIAKLIVQLIFACTEDEAKLNMLKDQRLCTSPTAIGTYCSADFLGICLARREAYCCFSSAFGRVFQEQARPQLGKNFGTPKNPECSGLTVDEISHLNFDAMDFGEWIGMLQITGHLPKGALSADAMYDKSIVTKSKLGGSNNTNTKERLDKQTGGTDVDEIRQHLLDNL